MNEERLKKEQIIKIFCQTVENLTGTTWARSSSCPELKPEPKLKWKRRQNT